MRKRPLCFGNIIPKCDLPFCEKKKKKKIRFYAMTHASLCSRIKQYFWGEFSENLVSEFYLFNFGRLVYRVTRTFGRTGRKSPPAAAAKPNIGTEARVVAPNRSARTGIWHEVVRKSALARAPRSGRAAERVSSSSLISPSFRSKYSSGCGTTGCIRRDRSASRL